MGSKEHKKELEKKNIPVLTKTINKSLKQQKKLEIARENAKTPEEANKYTEYIDKLENIRNDVLDAMTPEKIKSATLAQLAKTFRVLAEKAENIQNSKEKQIKEERKLNVNINIDIENMSKEDLLSLLGRKSQQYSLEHKADE